MFRRRRRQDEADEPMEALPATDEETAEAGEDRGLRPRPEGPWDIAEVENPEEGRVDLGGILVPVVEGMELRVEVANDQIVAATAIHGQSALQLQPFAAPRSEGIWDEVRHEIAAGVTQQGGIVDEVEGPLGPELRAHVPLQLPDGTYGTQLVRFVGCDGPRWFLRGVFSGQAAVQPETAGVLEAVFRGVVVVRGKEPMAPRDPIPLRLPPNAMSAGPQDEDERFDRDDLNPFERGPEITEVR
ncbi:hypothetical protein TH66_16105 [Carbonactinospora thermoautotrophica]|uniref:DUF3710 domain-containing protein n=1 Tax=Carbonactinospora thermoautotrophica TaxID=1469144 RepID=A0A132MRV8_9ACTN|nr:DUF3710 domain-containing protein [Carbonactinospora thermoautotrophica]KWX00583.1 hypothetical protein TH66_16105 [Carbonactinospora thermoautotrophica]KWX08019.1 hypothetical protein TR74_16790 [Carbonactinospora thermoautotrophica]